MRRRHTNHGYENRNQMVLQNLDLVYKQNKILKQLHIYRTDGKIYVKLELHLVSNTTAKTADLPVLSPYKSMDLDFGYGVNFTVAGSTALAYNKELLNEHNVISPITNASLGDQLDSMSSNYFTSTSVNDVTRMCGTPVCEKPNQCMSWDGIDLTEEINKFIAEWFADTSSSSFNVSRL